MARPEFRIPQAKNNIRAQLLGGIGVSDTSIALKSGEGATMPTITRGEATSAGDEVTLIDTGAFASGTWEGKIIENLTDGSYSVVTEKVDNDTLKTIPLEGGSANIWDSGDVWAIGAYVLTFTQFTAAGAINKQERVKVTDRSTDTLTVERSYGGDTAQSFNADDYVYLMVEQSVTEEVKSALGNLMMRIDDFYRGVPHYGVATGSSNTYAVTLDRTYKDYDDIIGKEIRVKANHTSSGVSTLNVNGMGAKTIKRVDGATSIANGDIQTDQIITVIYDGTNFQMVSPSGNAPSPQSDNGLFGDGSDGDVTLVSNTTLTRDMFYDNLDLDTYTLDTAGYRVFVRQELSGTGKITTNEGGVGGDASGTAGGSAGAAGAGVTVPSGFAGSAGQTGAAAPSFNSKNNGTAGGDGDDAVYSLSSSDGADGAAGGNGGAVNAGPSATGSGGTGGAAGSGGTATAAKGHVFDYVRFGFNKGDGTFDNFDGNGGSGGSGSGGSGFRGSSACNAGTGGGSGGNGGGGAMLLICANTIAGTFTIESLGGDGGVGGDGGNASGGGANDSCGGGGGGSGGTGGEGGLCLMIYKTKSWTGSEALTGGSGGAGGAAGTGKGNGGVNGSAGNAGASGGDGVLFEVDID